MIYINGHHNAGSITMTIPGAYRAIRRAGPWTAGEARRIIQQIITTGEAWITWEGYGQRGYRLEREVID